MCRASDVSNMIEPLSVSHAVTITNSSAYRPYLILTITGTIWPECPMVIITIVRGVFSVSLNISHTSFIRTPWWPLKCVRIVKHVVY